MKKSLFATISLSAIFALFALGVGPAAAQYHFQTSSDAAAAPSGAGTSAADAAALLSASVSASVSLPAADARQIYEWRVYTLAEGGDAAAFDAFLRDALLPAYGRHGVKVGAFAPAQEYREFPSGARYLFFAWPDIATYQHVSRAVREDAALAAAGAGYFDASAPKPAYTACETYLCEAFDAIPTMRPIPAERGLVEWRVYRSPNMDANERKIKMFENGEMTIFDDTGVNIVCFGRTLAGSRMPSLVYLTWYRDMDARNAAWERFGADPRWRRMTAMPEYAHTATDNLVRLLAPLPWSQY